MIFSSQSIKFIRTRINVSDSNPHHPLNLFRLLSYTNRHFQCVLFDCKIVCFARVNTTRATDLKLRRNRIVVIEKKKKKTENSHFWFKFFDTTNTNYYYYYYNYSKNLMVLSLSNSNNPFRSSSDIEIRIQTLHSTSSSFFLMNIWFLN